MNKSAKIFAAGHRGMVGNALVCSLQSKGYTQVITATRDQLDLLDQKAIYAFLENERPEYILLLPPKWVAYMPTIRIAQILFSKT
jgi:GDP-L-fucose synthase